MGRPRKIVEKQVLNLDAASGVEESKDGGQEPQSAFEAPQAEQQSEVAATTTPQTELPKEEEED